MSGFLAMRSADGPVPASVADALVAVASHRGAPERFVEDGVLLVSFTGRRGSGLAVAEDLAMALDLRIDNARELDRQLGASPRGDAERFLLAWRRWGTGALDRVIGDFAGAVWDRRRRELTIVRDPMAGRPALIATGRGRVLAGSSVRMLLEDPAVDRAIDEQWVAMYLSKAPLYYTETGYGSIRRLVPGTRARERAAGWAIDRWFRWHPRRIRERDPAAYGEGFRELFEEAVGCRLDGVNKAGVSLSGGLDSTSVLVVARKLRPDLDLLAVSIPFSDRAGDERSMQSSVAQLAGARHRWVPLDGLNPYWRGARDALETFGAPPVPPNRFHVDALADAASAEGIEVALDGIDGDSVLGSNFHYLSDLAVTMRWRRYVREFKAMRAVQHVGGRAILRDLTVWPLLPATVRLAYRRARGRRHTPDFMSQTFARAHRIERSLELEPWRPGRAYATEHRLAVAPMIAPLMLESIDEQWSRRGVEVAHPFLDRRLVEYCLGLPREQKTALGYTKLVLRAAMKGLLPPEVAERADKANLSEAFLAGLRGSGGTEVSKGLDLASSNSSAWVAPVSVDMLRERFEQGHDSFSAYRVAYLGHWLDWLGSEGSITEADARRDVAPAR